MAELAARVELSESAFGHLFEASVGVSPARFRVERRLHAATLRLTTSFDRIGQVAQSVGIPDVHTFWKVFRRRFGLSPSEYRTQYWRGATRRS